MVKRESTILGLSRQLIGAIIAISTLFTVIVTGLGLYSGVTKIEFLLLVLRSNRLKQATFLAWRQVLMGWKIVPRCLCKQRHLPPSFGQLSPYQAWWKNLRSLAAQRQGSHILSHGNGVAIRWGQRLPTGHPHGAIRFKYLWSSMTSRTVLLLLAFEA